MTGGNPFYPADTTGYGNGLSGGGIFNGINGGMDPMLDTSGLGGYIPPPDSSIIGSRDMGGNVIGGSLIGAGGVDASGTHNIFGSTTPSGGFGNWPSIYPGVGLGLAEAILASIALTRGVPDLTAPGATPAQVVSSAAGIVTDPLGATNQTVSNVGNQVRGVFRPDPENDAQDTVVIPAGAIGGNPSPATTVGNPRQPVNASGQTTNSRTTQGVGTTATNQNGSNGIVIPGGQSGQGDNGYPAQRTATATPTGGGTDGNGRSTVINGIDTQTGRPIDNDVYGPERVSPSIITPFGGPKTGDKKHDDAVTLLYNARTTPGSPPFPPVLVAPVNRPNTTTPTGSPPTPRDLYDEGVIGTDAYKRLGRDIFENYSGNAGNYGRQDLNNLGGLYGLQGNPFLGDVNAAASQVANAQTGAAMRGFTGNLAGSGGDLLALLKQYNPDQYSGLSAANRFGSSGAGSLGGDLEAMARQQLALGSGLSAAQIHDSQQSARAADSARGLLMGPSAVGNEVLMQDRYGQELLRQRQGFASGVNQNLASNSFQNAALQSQAAFNPSQYFGNATGNYGTNAQVNAMGTGFSSGANSNQYVQGLANPYSEYGADVHGTNFNSATAQYIAGLNNAAALQGANTKANSALVSGFLKFAGDYFSRNPTSAKVCWVAREVFGVESPKWLLFRHWLCTKAPRWFLRAYLKYGERFAAWISDKSILKSMIRRWMESKILTIQGGY